MPMNHGLQSTLMLIVGLGVGAMGAVMMRGSLAGPEGSAEERVLVLESELKKAGNRIAALEAGGGGAHGGRTAREGFSDLAKRLQAGEKVTTDDVLAATQPLIRDLSPIFERMHAKQIRDQADAMSGEFARRYDLTDEQREGLKKWFSQQAEGQAREWANLVSREGTTMQDLAEAARAARVDEGLDGYMEGVLAGEKLETFRAERLAEKAGRVQQEADRAVSRVEDLVALDDAQRDQLFGAMARASQDYDPRMNFEGSAGVIEVGEPMARDAALREVLRDDQWQALEDHRAAMREQEAARLGEMGLSLPDNWDPIEW